MPKLWRRIPKDKRAEVAATVAFVKAKYPTRSLIGLLRKAAVPVVEAHAYVPPAPKLRNLGGRLLGPTEIVMHAELKRDGVKYAARQPYLELARQRDKQAQEVPVES